MPNLLYPKAKEAFLSGTINLTSDTIRMGLIDTSSYTYADSHQTLTDIPSGARVADAILSSKTVLDGIFDAADVTFGSVSGGVVNALLLWKVGSDDGASPLIAYFDTNVAGLPATADGGTLVVAWAAGGIFRL